MSGAWMLLRPLCALLAAVFLCQSPAARALTVTDDLGVSVSFEQAPQRIISLLPSLTETVCALGHCHRLVGVDRDSDYPPQVRDLPQLGGGLDPDIEAIVALRPDVVLAAASPAIGERLRRLGVKVVAMTPASHADVQRVLLKTGRLLATADAHKVWRAMQAGVDAAAQSLPPSSRGMRVYFEVNQGPYAASEASFIGETLSRLGVKNIVPAALGAFPKLNPEYVVRANPDLIMIGQSNPQSLARRPGWLQIRAVREQRVCTFTPQQANILVRPGPRMGEAARLMAACLGARALTAEETKP